jgi:glycosyltransferase involved in cell wall biosynthesis
MAKNSLHLAANLTVVAEVLTTPRAQPSDSRLAALRRVALVPAHNEEDTVGSVVEEIKAFDPQFEVLVIDDGSTDRTAAVAERAGARVVRLAYNLGIGGAVQTGIQYACDQGFELAIQIDGDAQHPPSEMPRLLEPILEGRADLVIGSRFLGPREYEPPFSRLVGIKLLARIVSLIVRQRVTDTTSGYRAMNRQAIRVFAADYPHDYPEVEATVLVFRHRLRMTEVPVRMRERESGSSSITFARSAYYMIKVLLALFVGLFRRFPTPLEE